MSETVAQNNEATLEQTLNRTDFGHFIYENRKAFFAALAVVFIGAVGFFGWKQMQKNEALRIAGVVYSFSQDNLTGLKDGKISADDFLAKFKALPSEAHHSGSMVALALDVAQTMDQKNATGQAAQVLETVLSGQKNNELGYVLLAHNYAAYSEKLGKPADAIRVLEAAVAGGQKVLLTKAYVDLGRLYLAQGDKTKAKTNFDYVIANFPNDDMSKLARLYLQEVTTK